MELSLILVSAVALVMCVPGDASTGVEASKREQEAMTLGKIYADMDRGLKGVVRENLKSVLRTMEAKSRELNVSSKCVSNAFKILSGLRDLKPWAVSFLDATGKPSDGLMNGNINMFGNYDQCLNTTVFKRGGALDFRGQYCLVSISTHLPDPELTPDNHERIALVKRLTQNVTEAIREYVLKAEMMRKKEDRFGLCVPSGCGTEDVDKLVQYAGKQLLLNLTLNFCETEDSLTYINPSRIAILCIYSFFILLVIISSVVDRYSATRQIQFKSPAMRGLLCFSLPHNFQKFTNTEATDGNLTCLNGIRVLSLFWIILAHHYVVKIHSMMTRNLLTMFIITWPPRFFSQILINGTLSVETFFFIGGFLNCYMRAKKNLTVFSLSSSLRLLIHRLIRLYPILIMCILLFLLLNPRGPMAHYMEESFMEECKTHWWKNLLFINNFFDVDHQCIAHSWYLAADMQFFLISLFTIPLLFRNPKVGVLAHLAIIVLSTAVAVFRIWVKNLPPSVVLRTDQLALFRIHDLVDVMFSPFPHVSSYFGGVLLGFFLAKREKSSTPKITRILGWIVANAMVLTTLFISKSWNSGHPYTRMGAALFFSLSKLIFSWSVGWILFCCFTGQGGFIRSILSWKVWVPLNRLCLSAYLLSIILQEYFFGNLRAPQDLQTEVEIWGFFGDVTVTCLLSVPMVLLFESPFIALENVFFSKAQNSSRLKESEMNGKEILQREKDASDKDKHQIKA